MSRVLVVEPDGSTRTLMARVLVAGKHVTEAVATAMHAKLLLDDDGFDIALVDEMTGRSAPLDDIRWLRENYPQVQVVLTGGVLSQHTLMTSFRLGVADVLAKPFTPDQLRECLTRAITRATPGHARALDYAAAMRAARTALVLGQPEEAAAPLARLHALLPLDTQAMTLEALRAELLGHDADADRAYRAALALGVDPADEPPDPHEGLARLAAYPRDANVLRDLPPEFAHAPVWIVTDPAVDIEPTIAETPLIVLHTLGFAEASELRAATYVRADAQRAVLLSMAAGTAEALARTLASVTDGTAHVADAARDRIDLGRLETLRREVEKG